ncbi:hypothetical protein, partial [Flavobacterium sp. RSP29]|uniref:hypothetical protein n=1 Tax=Flavobacterium sp. RSP29 TaxID=3401731 RepID=UPI003AAECF8A
NKNNQLFYLSPSGFSFPATPSKKTQKGKKCHQQRCETLHLRKQKNEIISIKRDKTQCNRLAFYYHERTSNISKVTGC